uniref:Protein kinase domain-containing protein n=1 Tax=Oryza rufipogon TaxID=4529 RepID=A0A0E0MQM6_ORYRU
MRGFLAATLLVLSLLLNLHTAASVSAWEDKDFFSYCPPSRCGEHGPEIRFPFKLESKNTPSSCGVPCMKLSCSGQYTILHNKYLGRPYKFTCQTTSSVAAFVILLLMVATALYLSLRTRYNEEIHLKVEMFLKTYGTSKPTRYTFSEVKKIASRFKVKVGQGGFGSVYRGELPNGVPVAVKMLENSKGEGDEFINEVATIGRIHHANIVRLLGFCLEGTRRALIYEYMPNDSLEKYIFSHDSDTSQEVLVPNKMLDIALGIARGMEYLHQGCNQRILHFDIKPHNILLDYNFSMMGYIAPELYSRNFGEISYKSDVYSFGMLVLEMVSGRRNSDPSVESQNMVYFPEWIYEQVTAGQDLALGREMNEEEKATTRQLAIVALWCIQWNPNNRPSMTKVVNMLTGRLQNLQVHVSESLQTRYNEEIHLKVEMFLKTYGTSKPTRYSFSEIKKIARRFKIKLGQGGFGSVYRGELPNGVPVAVKMLENSKGEGEEFINEVSTIGRIHHANIVRLLGFCSEGTRRALIYEFMPNESLEKYIFSDGYNILQELLVPNKMLDIALGIARGMEYLHQGGTMGYIAPELYSRNFGEISYKSDVYSFGMLVLEMVSGRRNSDPSVESQNVVNSGQDLALGREMTQEEKETVRQLAIVALWCIQWNPKNRPSMTKVVNMLTGRLQNLQVPPKPFLSADSYPVLLAEEDTMHTENRMRGFLAAALLVFGILLNLDTAASAWEHKDFFSYCPPSRCSEHGPEVRFPFQLESNNTTQSSCGLPFMKLSCSGQDTILDNKCLGRPYKVTAIDYKHPVLTAVPLADEGNSSSPCPLLKSISIRPSLKAHNGYHYMMYQKPCETYVEHYYAALVSCSTEFAPASIPDATDDIVGPISCLSNQTHLSYLVEVHASMSLLTLDCEVISDGPIPIPVFHYSIYDLPTFRGSAERILNFSDTTVWWYRYDCPKCEQLGGRCAFSSQRNQTFCMRRGSHVKVIAATSSVAAFVVLLLMVATALYLSLKTRYNEEIHLKVEMFLKTYGTSKPTRYTFSEVKKISRRFKVKVGQGGFGSVYRGELPNGVPVAVKMLENSEGEGDEFINEVATIGRIHHANIVRLLGFCSEGTRRALIYEYMPNDSLEKYIFSQDSDTSQELLVPSKMLDIALGIARGMEYLHQGCNQRILHFDIKPNNILLDYNFSPKISDFGLAKLCARDQSIITLTAARGTMGYIAPELYSRNFGEISYKSDVYSFGMLVLEMVSGRRNSDPSVESQNVVYFPEWIYEQVTIGQDLELGREMTEEEKAIMRQLAIVALWCIQWNPKNRPSMTKVVNMLTGRLQNLQVPPKPFFSADSHPVLQDSGHAGII